MSNRAPGKNMPDLNAFRRAIELYILDEAQRRGITRCALHVDVAALPEDDGVDVMAIVLTLSPEDRDKLKAAVDARNAARKGKN